MDCPHWIAGAGAADCTIGEAGGHPSRRRCERCRVMPGVVATGETMDVPDPPSRVTAFDGSALWAELHLHEPGPDTAAFLRSSAMRIPCGECRRHFLAWLNAGLDLSPDGYFASMVDFHNAVNQKLGRPLMSLDAARQKWTP